MTDKVNGGVATKETLTGDMDFFVVHTVVALTEGAYGSTASATRNLVKFMETVSTGAQPVLVSVTSGVRDLSDSGQRTIYGLGTDFNQASTTVYTVKFAIEHAGALLTGSDANNGALVGSLAYKFDGAPVPFPTTAVPITGPATRTESAWETTSASARNLSVTHYSVLT